MSGSSLAQLSKYTAWISTASIWLAAIASRKACTSSSRNTVGRHMRGDWLKIWIARQSRSKPRSIAFGNPPAGDT